MTNDTLTFIGGGNMARSLIGGLVERFDAASIRVADPVAEIRDGLGKDFGVHTMASNAEACQGASCIVLAVKPQMMRDVLEPLGAVIGEAEPLLVSIAAGIRIDSISQWLGGYDTVVRAMPNTPALVQTGASGLYATDQVSQTHREQAFTIMSAVGTAAWVEREDLIDVVTALSGSGPAYFFYLLEIITEKAVELGLEKDVARDLALQTALGAAELARQSNVDFQTLRRNVTSPGGTTEAAIEAMEHADARAAIGGGVQAAALRSDELARLLGA